MKKEKSKKETVWNRKMSMDSSLGSGCCIFLFIVGIFTFPLGLILWPLGLIAYFISQKKINN